ncbi:ATP-binding protein [Neptunomonas antarctica]|nr:ATP-binding protein [Neptunomonas antarctica]
MFILIIINSSFQQGFANYLQQKEIRLANDMTEFLVQHYQQQKSWKLMQHNHKLWEEALESANISIPPGPGPRRAHDNPPPKHLPQQEESSRGALPPHRPLAMRISLYDAEKKLFFGPPDQSVTGHWIEINTQKQLIGWLYLSPTELIGEQLANSFVEQQQQNFIVIAAAVMLLSLVVAAIWAQLLLRPVNRVIYAVHKLSAGQYDIRVPVRGNDELTGLALNFNRMAEALQQNERLRRQWLTDISHELRTPLAVISGEVEALLDGIRQPTKENITSLQEEIIALTHLIEDLHQLAMADNDALDLHFTECDLYSIIEHQVQMFKPRMKMKNLQLKLKTEPKEGCKISADSRRISQLMSNLLENSLRYTDPGGSVEVQLYNDTKQLTIVVSDTKPGVSNTDQEKIFDRLYCADKSRSRSAGGSGLGLAICKAIVTAHGGIIFAENLNGGGLRITAQLPLIPV